jgi:hypothetical protein
MERLVVFLSMAMTIWGNVASSSSFPVVSTFFLRYVYAIRLICLTKLQFQFCLSIGWCLLEAHTAREKSTRHWKEVHGAGKMD